MTEPELGLMRKLGQANNYPIPRELPRTYWGGEWARKVERTITTPPTRQEWDDYREANALLDRLYEFGCFDAGGPDYAANVEKPRDHHEFIYAETKDEWIARTDAMIADGKKPEHFMDRLYKKWSENSARLVDSIIERTENDR